MTSDRARIAVIGCGRIAGHHARSIAMTENADLVAVCDLIPAKAHAYRDEFRTKAYTDYREMLDENPEINTVAVITPSGMHFEHGLEIIERFGKNIIVEKPTFMTPSQLVKAYAAARDRGVEIFPVFQNRHNHAVQRVKRGLESGELGEIRTVAIRVRWCRPQRYYGLAEWRGTMALDGGALTNQGVHHVDLFRYCGGEVERVAAAMRTLAVNVEVEDTVTGAAVFRNGALGAVEVTTAARPNDYEASISLVCDKGVAQIGGVAVNELQIYTPDPEACRQYSEDFAGNVYGHGHEQIYREIAAFHQEGAPFSVTYDDALATLKLLHAFYVADERGAWVDVATAGDSARLGRPDEALADLYRTPQSSVERR